VKVYAVVDISVWTQHAQLEGDDSDRGVRTKLLKSASLLDRRRSEAARGAQENVFEQRHHDVLTNVI